MSKTAAIAAVLPLLVAHLAYALNIWAADLEACWPYWDGCMSVSRAIRSGPGLWLFKLSALPIAIAMVLTWRGLPENLGSPVIRLLGTLGALFLLLYAFALGTDGAFYGWMRRFGVVFYFGLTGLAQLLLGRVLARHDRGLPPWTVNLYFAVLALTWLSGIASAFKRRLVSDPNLVNRLESALEWWFALGLSLGFLTLAVVLYHDHRRPQTGLP